MVGLNELIKCGNHQTVEPGTQQASNPQCRLLERGLCPVILAPSGGQGGLPDGKSREASWACRERGELSVRRTQVLCVWALLAAAAVCSRPGRPLLLHSPRSPVLRSGHKGPPFCSSLLQLIAASQFFAPLGLSPWITFSRCFSTSRHLIFRFCH